MPKIHVYIHFIFNKPIKFGNQARLCLAVSNFEPPIMVSV